MNQDLIILVGAIASIAAGLACVLAHRIANHYEADYIPRYMSGVAIGLFAFAFPLFAGLGSADALAYYGVAWLIFGVMGIASWLADKAQPANPRARIKPQDELRDLLDKELRK